MDGLPRISAEKLTHAGAGVFPFGDLDTLFSSTFVMIIARIIDLDPGNTAAQTIARSCTILEYMERNGNRAAGQRRRDILRITELLSVILPTTPDAARANPSRSDEEQDLTIPEHAGAEPREGDMYRQQTSSSYDSGAKDDAPPADLPSGQTLGDTQPLIPETWVGGFDPLTETNEILQNEELNCDPALTAMFTDQDARLAGSDMLDWGDLELYLSQAQYPSYPETRQ